MKCEELMANFHPTSEYVTFDQLREELRKKPDLVEVVRCRDCKWYHGSGVASLTPFCTQMEDANVEPDGFCAWGERR